MANGNMNVQLIVGGGEETNLSLPQLSTLRTLIQRGHFTEGATVMLNGAKAQNWDVQLRDGDEIEVVPKSGKQGLAA